MNMLSTREAVVIGIDAYGRGIAPLTSAVADARAIADILGASHGYRIAGQLLDQEATGTRILRLLEEDLPTRLDSENALLLYFAGHGMAHGNGGDPAGFLLPQDAHPADETTWLAMERIKSALAKLPCRHLLVVLDCCFAGSFRWTSTRNFMPLGRPLFDSQYDRYLCGTAWQVLTSAAHDEKALDIFPGSSDHRGADGKGHSPFTTALLRGLDGEADSSRGSHHPDGVMTATELYQYVFEELVPPGSEARQTPGLWPLKPENTGEFIFLSPHQEKQTRPDPPLDDDHNPWLGLSAYDAADAPLFFGRERVANDFVRRLVEAEQPPLLAVVGASGSGKSSVVKAGLVPLLRSRNAPAWTVVSTPRLQGDPRRALAAAEKELDTASGDHPKLLVIDQFEEVFTQCSNVEARDHFFARLRELMADPRDPLRIVLTVRSDFEPRLKAAAAFGDLFAAGRYPMPALSLEEMREIIEKPAAARALFFESENLVDELVDEVLAMPGGLPLLSFALAETYRQAQIRRRESGIPDQALRRRDYEAAGGVVGSIHRRASELYNRADCKSQKTIRRLFLRLVSQKGGRLARRRVEERELVYARLEERERLDEVLEDYVKARLLVADEGCVEPAHDTLVMAWEKLLAWLEKYGSQDLQRQIWRASSAWATAREKSAREARGLLWSQDPRLPQAYAVAAELNALEGRFVAASTRYKRRRRAALSAMVAAVVLLLAGAALYSESKRRQAGAALERTRGVVTFLEDLLAATNPFDTSTPGAARGTSLTVRELLDHGRDQLRDTFEDDPRTRAQLMDNLGSIYGRLGHFDEAEPLLRQALVLRRETLGEAHPEIADSLHSLGGLLGERAIYDDAEPLLREALRMRRRLLDPEHSDVAESVDELAIVLHGMGHYEEAERLYREALALRQKLFGEEHPDVAVSLHNLATLLHDIGDYEVAEKLYRADLEMSRRLLGRHVDVATSLGSLAGLLEGIGDFEAAEPLLREALEMRRQLLGPEHPTVAGDLGSLASLLHNMGDYEAAESLFRQTLDLDRRLLGDEHPNIAANLNNLAFLSYDQGKYERAEALFRQALQMNRRIFGDAHDVVAVNLNNLGLSLHAQGDVEAAETAVREALVNFRQALPAGHWRIANAESILGAVFAVRGHYEKAESLLVTAYPVVRDAKGNNSIYARDILKRLVSLYEAWNQTERAEEYRALGMAARSPAANSEEDPS